MGDVAVTRRALLKRAVCEKEVDGRRITLRGRRLPLCYAKYEVLVDDVLSTEGCFWKVEKDISEDGFMGVLLRDVAKAIGDPNRTLAFGPNKARCLVLDAFMWVPERGADERMISRKTDLYKGHVSLLISDLEYAGLLEEVADQEPPCQSGRYRLTPKGEGFWKLLRDDDIFQAYKMSRLAR
jgi:hypothetical protein